jgi:hypothetical protein
MFDGPNAIWDAEFTAEAFASAPAKLLESSVWHIGVEPTRFITAEVRKQRPWRPENGTEGSFRFTSPSRAQLELFPGMPLLVQIDGVAVGRATVRVITNAQRRKRLFSGVASLEWWIMDCGLPDLIWARLRSWEDGHADVLSVGGIVEHFATTSEAASSLGEDEYRDLEVFDQSDYDSGRNLPLIWPPEGASDGEVVPHLYQRWCNDLQRWKPQ